MKIIPQIIEISLVLGLADQESVVIRHKIWRFPLRISSVNVTKSDLLKKSLMENFIFCAVLA